MTHYYKFNVKVFEHLKDMEKSCVLMFLVQMAANNKKEVIMQKTWLAKKLFCSRTKTERLIKELIDEGLIKTETTYIEVNGVTKTTTRFMFTAKLLELLGEGKQTTKQPSIIAKKGNEEKQIKTQNTNYTDYWENKILKEYET